MIKTKAPLRILCDGMKGENYWTHGCMTYIAACLGLPKEYNYQFFNCYAGDSVTQVFSKDPKKDVWHLSQSLTGEGLARSFRAMGYSYTYITGLREKDMGAWLPKIRESLDRGLPVMARNGQREPWIEFNCIVGYEDDALLVLFCDHDTAEPVTEYNFTDLVFIGEKIAEPVPVGEAYREAVLRIPELLTMPETDELSFGVQAFTDWAKQLSDGSLADYDNEWHNVWSVHGTYLCMLGSNDYGYGILDKAQEYNPDMGWLDAVKPLYAELQEIFKILACYDGGIDMKPEDVRNLSEMEPVCKRILDAADITKQIAEMIQKH